MGLPTKKSGGGHRNLDRPTILSFALKMLLQRMLPAGGGPTRHHGRTMVSRTVTYSHVPRRTFRRGFHFLYLFIETSSIHGCNHLKMKNLAVCEYMLWISLVFLGSAGAASLGLSIWHRYQQNPTVISIERDSYEWRTDLPAITLCPTKKVNDSRVQDISRRLVGGKDIGEVAAFLNSLAGATYSTFADVVNTSVHLAESNFQQFVLKVTFDAGYVATHSETESTTPQLWRHMGEMGICYSYNTRVAFYNSPEYWNNTLSVPQHPAILSGNALDGDLSTNVKDQNSGSVVFLHDPNEILDSAMKGYRLSKNMYVEKGFLALVITSSIETRSLSISQRKCRFPEESNLFLSPVYTYNMCRMECRMMQAHKLCGCVPYFYKRNDQLKTCDVQGMLCLSKYSDSLVRLLAPGAQEKLQCGCLPLCNSMNYVEEVNIEKIWTFKTVLQWKLSSYPQMRLKRDVLFGFSDLLVSLGGTAGLFLGCSILSFIEIIYFFSVRLVCYVLSS